MASEPQLSSMSSFSNRHETSGISPSTVTFGRDLHVGLGSPILPKNALLGTFTEEELGTFLSENEKGAARSYGAFVPHTNYHYTSKQSRGMGNIALFSGLVEAALVI
ncbi:KRAB-A domain-containing protein 2 [Plakobranchus ocellatus]|uniref:KRAB-A domain-containing protein 2 n=1 Tax=Plakobranchus ocellatus TaxID=259542 RepID=A0AAV4CU81_9GAST|nr:KRAB-A domain-containing protein 2 [Plakobranchus ocellatus]